MLFLFYFIFFEHTIELVQTRFFFPHLPNLEICPIGPSCTLAVGVLCLVVCHVALDLSSS